MQSENFDKKIKDLLSQRPPGHDNPAWDKMEQMLDRHLPKEKKDNRRIFFLLFMFLLVGGGAFFLLYNNNGNKNNIVSNKPVNEVKEPATKSDQTPAGKSTGSVPKGVPANTTGQSSQENKSVNPESTTPVTAKVAEQTSFRNTNKPGSKKSGNTNTINSIAKNKKTSTKNVTLTGPIEELIKEPEPEVENRPAREESAKTNTQTETTAPVAQEKNESAKEAEPIKEENKTAAEDTKEKPVAKAAPKPARQKNSKSFANNFFVTASAGPDFSAVGGTAGKVQLAWGGGIGYQVSKRFSIRTGVYSGRKVYTANPEDYHPPYNFWQYYPNLKSIEANCKVTEIPVTVDYTISKKQKGSWFVSTGVSSLLMKEETYDYYFKPNSSPTYVTYSRTIKNQNKHYFSVLGLSGGYTRVLNNHVSLRAEPYVKMAMSGIGYGKVDLNSGGVLVSAIIRPFRN